VLNHLVQPIGRALRHAHFDEEKELQSSARHEMSPTCVSQLCFSPRTLVTWNHSAFPTSSLANSKQSKTIQNTAKLATAMDPTENIKKHHFASGIIGSGS
jgi:hypothetical protein